MLLEDVKGEEVWMMEEVEQVKRRVSGRR